ncbi:SNF2-related protein [Candidatus Nitrosotenuis cloacae]|uniref:SNF2-related protein n=1 Tax=Candidatus Nitrosotenuis cloacae TaxID=1603555 RepID=UPI003B968C9E
MDRYPLEILSKNVWQKKLPPSAKQVTKKPKRIEKLNLANPGKQFRGNLLNFQREGLDFLIKSTGNALLADEMGLGKCISGESLIHTVGGNVKIGDLWSESSILEENGDESWGRLPKPITVQTFDGKKLIGKKVDRIFRQKVNEQIVRLALWDGSALECTKKHRFLTPDGWRRAGELSVGDRVAVPAKTQLESSMICDEAVCCQPVSVTGAAVNGQVLVEGQSVTLSEKTPAMIHWCPIKELKMMHHNGYVYDLSVPQTHNYLVNGMITHNTVQTLAYVATEQNTFPALIVAPLVTLQNWQREIDKFMKRKSRNGRLIEDKAPTSTIIRVGKSEDLGKYDFYIINYELLFKRYKDLAKLNLRTIVCDEVQNLRSKTTQKYQAIKKLSALESVKYRVGLSGTPIYNRGSEIWPIVDILRPGLLGSFKEFCEYFCYVNEKGKAIVLENKRESLRNMLQKHVMLRRKKTDVLTELKEKIRYKEIIDADINYYNSELAKIWKKLEDERKEAQSAFDASTAYQRAIQSERQAAGVAKLPHVINFVKNIMEIEESVVVFCHHKAIHSLLHQALAEFKPSSIIGGQSDTQRQSQIDAFQNGDTKLMIAGLRAGNVGINLTRARYVIFAELDWSPAIHLQAEDRLHRIGQKSTVFAYYLMGNGTLDEHVAKVLVDKSYEIDAIMDNKVESFENKEKAELILAQIHDKIRSILRN